MVTKGIRLWNTYASPRMLREYASLFNFHNGITICNQSEEFLEIFNFATPADNHSAIDFYFKDRATKLIDQAYKARFIIPDAMRGTATKDQSYNEFLKLIQTNKIQIILDLI